MKLTILIPTRNRASRLIPLIKFLFNNVLIKIDPQEFEVIVLNNASTDNTREELEKLKFDGLRVIHRDVLLDTSEQNISDGIKYAKGEFIWFLGDDDIPLAYGFDIIWQLISGNEYDFIVSNFKVLAENGHGASLTQVRNPGAISSQGLVPILNTVGLVNMFSGWSIIICRRSALDTKVLERLISVSPIYAHCFWFLFCFKDLRCFFNPIPLVEYRVFFNAEGWSSYTRKNNKPLFYYWSVGLLKLFNHALGLGLLNGRDIFYLCEYRHDGTRYRVLDEMVVKTIEQLELAVKSESICELWSEQDFEFLKECLEGLDPSFVDVFIDLSKIFHNIKYIFDTVGSFTLEDKFKILEEIHDVHQEFVSRPLIFASKTFIAFFAGYCIFQKENDTFVAIRRDHLDHYRKLDGHQIIVHSPPLVLIGSDLASIHELILQEEYIPDEITADLHGFIEKDQFEVQKENVNFIERKVIEMETKRLIRLIGNRDDYIQSFYFLKYFALRKPNKWRLPSIMPNEDVVYTRKMAEFEGIHEGSVLDKDFSRVAERALKDPSIQRLREALLLRDKIIGAFFMTKLGGFRRGNNNPS